MGQAMNLRSERNLIGVEDDMIMVVQYAFELISDDVTRLPGCKMVIVDGLRTEEEQIQNMVAGVSWTMNSKHLPNDNGKSEAIDFALVWKNKVVQQLPVYERVWMACYRPSGHFLGLDLEWGGNWKSRDGPHIQMNV